MDPFLTAYVQTEDLTGWMLFTEEDGEWYLLEGDRFKWFRATELLQIKPRLSDATLVARWWEQRRESRATATPEPDLAALQQSLAAERQLRNKCEQELRAVSDALKELPPEHIRTSLAATATHVVQHVREQHRRLVDQGVYIASLESRLPVSNVGSL